MFDTWVGYMNNQGLVLRCLGVGSFKLVKV
jgi:hypothetical protein